MIPKFQNVKISKFQKFRILERVMKFPWMTRIRRPAAGEKEQNRAAVTQRPTPHEGPRRPGPISPHEGPRRLGPISPHEGPRRPGPVSPEGPRRPGGSRSPSAPCSGTLRPSWCRTRRVPRNPPSAPRCTRCGRSSPPADTPTGDSQSAPRRGLGGSRWGNEELKWLWVGSRWANEAPKWLWVVLGEPMRRQSGLGWVLDEAMRRQSGFWWVLGEPWWPQDLPTTQLTE